MQTVTRRQFVITGGASAALLASTARAPLFAATTSMRIGIIGSGKGGQAIGRAWVRAGHEVMFSSRTLEDDEALAAELGGRTRAGTPLEATNFGEALLLSVPYGAVPSIGKQLGGALKGKIVIDTSNPYPPRDGEIATVAEEKGAGLTSAELLPGARIVRAFNAIPWALVRVAYQNPGRVAMPMAGDDKEALDVASRLVRDVGYVPVVVGDLKFGRHLVPGSPLAGEHSPEEVQQIAAKLER